MPSHVARLARISSTNWITFDGSNARAITNLPQSTHTHRNSRAQRAHGNPVSRVAAVCRPPSENEYTTPHRYNILTGE